MMLLYQSAEAIDAANALFGPVGIILAIVVVVVVGYLTQQLNASRAREQHLVDKRAEEAKLFADRLQATVSEHAECLRKLEVDTLETLNDVLKLLDALESNDANIVRQIGDAASRIESKIDNIQSHGP